LKVFFSYLYCYPFSPLPYESTGETQISLSRRTGSPLSPVFCCAQQETFRFSYCFFYQSDPVPVPDVETSFLLLPEMEYYGSLLFYGPNFPAVSPDDPVYLLIPIVSFPDFAAQKSLFFPPPFTRASSAALPFFLKQDSCPVTLGKYSSFLLLREANPRLNPPPLLLAL